MTCYVTVIIIILLNSSLCSLTLQIHVQKTGHTAPSPFHLHKFWNSLDGVILEVSIAVHKAVSFFNVQSCTILYYTILYCTILYCTVLNCRTVVYCTVLYCTLLLPYTLVDSICTYVMFISSNVH